MSPRGFRALLVASFLLTQSGCGVDRLDGDVAALKILLELDEGPRGWGGDATRDDLGLFRLDLIGVYLAVTVSAEEIEDAVFDWPEGDVDHLPDEIELDLMVDAGQDRTIDVMLLIVGEDGTVSHHGATTTMADLPGGQQIDLSVHLEPRATASVADTIEVTVEASDVIEVHPVDREYLVVYPGCEFEIADGGLSVEGADVVPGRDLVWACKLVSGQWVLAETVTEVP